jgi:hypothetical protein
MKKFAAISQLAVCVLMVPLGSAQAEPYLPNFDGIWEQIDPAASHEFHPVVKMVQNGPHVMIWFNNAIEPTEAEVQEDGKLVQVETWTCSPPYQWGGYDYTNPNVNISTFELKGSTLLYFYHYATAPCGTNGAASGDTVTRWRRIW